MNKINTLYFYLKSNEEKFSFKSNEIIEQIQNQKSIFIKKTGYKPKYINIEQKIVDFLFKNQLKVITAKKISYPHEIYGMKIKLRNDSFGLNEDEIVCIEEGVDNEKI